MLTHTLYLKDSWFDAGDGQDVIYLPTVEVGQADGSDEALPHQLLHGSPGQLVVNVVIQQGAIFLSRESIVSSSRRYQEGVAIKRVIKNILNWRNDRN